MSMLQDSVDTGEAPTPTAHLANSAIAMFDRTNAATRLAGSTIGRAGAVHRFYINFAPGIIQGEWWYELSASLTNLPGAMLGWHIEVTDYGEDGLTRGGLVLGTTETMEDRYHLTSNGSLFGGLSFVKAADNFAFKAVAIPEPASNLILIWAGLLITFGGRSRI
jgi:hypothetical protein